MLEIYFVKSRETTGNVINLLSTENFGPQLRV